MALRPLSGDDLSMLGPWCREVPRTAKASANVDLLAITHREDGALIGVVGYRAGTPQDGWLGFDRVAVEPGLRGLGLDSEAVRLVEDDALGRGQARRFWAGVRQGDGPGLYFWLRLGYRPARPEESPWQEEWPRDTFGMVRMAASKGGRGGS